MAGLHVVALEFAAYVVLFRYGIGWFPYLLALALYVTAEVSLASHELHRDENLCHPFPGSSWLDATRFRTLVCLQEEFVEPSSPSILHRLNQSLLTE